MISTLAATLGTIANADEWLVYFGSFTGGASKGIYVATLNSASGALSEPRVAAEIANPNYLAVSPDEKFLFAATRPNSTGGFVDSFRIVRPSGMLAPIDDQTSEGAGPCHLMLDRSGRALLVANYNGGSVKSFRVSPDGRLSGASFIQHVGSSVNPSRQAGPHAHCIMPAPGDRFALVCDLGLDRLMIYRLNPDTAELAPGEPAFEAVTPGAGPRHLVFGHGGKRVYVVNEMAVTLSTFSWDGSNGRLAHLGTVSLLPEGGEVSPRFSAAAVVMRPDGKFIYTTVRGHDSVSVFSLDAAGMPSFIQNVSSKGKMPRGLGIDPGGKWLLVGNQDSDSVIQFAVDEASGRISATGRTLSIGSPVDVRFVHVAIPGEAN